MHSFHQPVKLLPRPKRHLNDTAAIQMDRSSPFEPRGDLCCDGGLDEVKRLHLFLPLTDCSNEMKGQSGKVGE